MLTSIQIAENKARTAVTFRRPTTIFEDRVQLMHLNYLFAFDGIFDGIIASRSGNPLIDQGVIIGAIGCSGGTGSQCKIVIEAAIATPGGDKMVRVIMGSESALGRKAFINDRINVAIDQHTRPPG